MSARPLNLYDALRMTVAETGEIQAKPGGHVESERRSPKVFATTETSFSLDLHVWGIAAEALSADLDRPGCVSHSRVPSRRAPNQAGMVSALARRPAMARCKIRPT
jgi:hypothetical protein